MYTLLKQEGMAKRARMETVHGTIETPVFMNVATAAAIKGGLSAGDLRSIDTQVALCNTYHLHVRTGDRTIHQLGGLHHFMRWDRPILTDSGGFQVFSLAELRKIKEEGVWFRSHIDGAKIFMGPEESMQIQSNLGSTIRLNEREDTVNRHQLLFGINQGAIYHDIRIRHAQEISDMDLDGYAIGGLAVGESHEQMYSVIEAVTPHLPKDKPTYLMGVGTPQNILEAVDRGVDFFDCVYPSRNGRHGNLYTHKGTVHIRNARYQLDQRPIEEGCGCPVCRAGYSRAYLRHLVKAQEALGLRMCVMHNLYFYNHLMQEIRDALDQGRYAAFKKETLERMETGEND